MSGRNHVRRRASTTRWALVRDTSTIVGAALLAILAFQLSGGGPGATPGFTVPPGETGIVVGSQDTAVATEPPPVTIGPVINPSVHIEATPTPPPLITLPPPTPTPTVTPTASTPTATLTVYLNVLNDQGGNDTASDWTVTVTGANPSPKSFKGAEAGTIVRISAGQTYRITATPSTVGGYSASVTGDCKGPVAAGLKVSCSILENDKPVRLTVTVKVSPPPATPADVTVTVTVGGVTAATFPGSSTGTSLQFDSNTPWNVSATMSATYAADYPGFAGGTCHSIGSPEGAIRSCTYTFTGPTPTPTLVPPLPLLPLWPLRRRRGHSHGRYAQAAS